MKNIVSLLLRQLGEPEEVVELPADEITALKEALAFAQERAAMHEKQVAQHEAVALQGKSEKLVSAISAANEKISCTCSN